MRLIKLRHLIREAVKENLEDPYHPPEHEIGMRVPKGGSMCANCRWLSDERYCSNKYFQRWNKEINGSDNPDELPEPADEYCCDNYEPTE